MLSQFYNRLLLIAIWSSVPLAIWYSIHFNDWTYFLMSVVLSRTNNFIGHNIGVHRYFTHRGFVTTKLKHQLLAVWSILLAIKSPLSYAMNHRHHHLYSDSEKDTHSPVTSFWHTLLCLWEFRSYKWFKDKGVEFRVKDLARDPTIKFIDRNYFKIWATIIGVSLLISWELTLFGFLLPAGITRITMNIFGNAVNHLNMSLIGNYRNYNTNDNSQNNHIAAWLSLGEGYHNNHHKDPNNYNQAHGKYEFDVCAWIIDRCFKLPDNQLDKAYKF
jgi:stearoyl-CoA desaturase (delta-9 desaturase)